MTLKVATATGCEGEKGISYANPELLSETQWNVRGQKDYRTGINSE